MVNMPAMTSCGRFPKVRVVPIATKHPLYSLMVVSATQCNCLLLHVILLLLGRLLYTAFRKCIIPPPMCAHVLTIPETMAVINQVTFSPCLQYMLVLSSMGHIMIYCLSQDGSLNKDQHGFQSKTPCPKLLNSTR